MYREISEHTTSYAIAMNIETPQAAVPNRDRSISLYFEWDEERKLSPYGDFDIRGGVCWPLTYRVDGAVDSGGYIIIAGKNLDNGVITIFEQHEFMVTEPIVNQETQEIEYPGVVHFLNNGYSTYFCRKYYWHQNFELSKRWRLEVLRSKMVEPKPQLVEVPWGDDQDADHLIWNVIKQGKLRHDPELELYRQLEYVKKTDKKKDILPAVRALQCVLMGMERFPIRRMEDAGVF